MKQNPIFRKIVVLFLACLFGGMGFLFAAVMAKDVAEELQAPWDLIVCFSMMIVGTAAGVTVAYLLGYGLPKKSKDKKTSATK